MTAIESRSDRDRIRQRSSGNKQKLDRCIAIYREFEQGRSPTECMRDIGRAIGVGSKMQKVR